MAYGERGREFYHSILEELVQMRHKFARLLGYSSYADYAVDLRMAKAPSKVFEFLEDISLFSRLGYHEAFCKTTL